MFKVTILFLSMFFLFACGNNKSEDEGEVPSSSVKNEQLAEKESLEAQLKQTTDKASCEEALSKFTKLKKPGEPSEETKGLDTTGIGGLIFTPPAGECTETGFQEKTE